MRKCWMTLIGNGDEALPGDGEARKRQVSVGSAKYVGTMLESHVEALKGDGGV